MAAFAAFTLSAHADQGFTTLGDNTLGEGISPNGRYVIGKNPSISMTGYVFDTTTGETKWITEYDESDYSKAGEFSAITDEGIICGTAYDPEHMITFAAWSGTVTSPAQSAAIWKDGQRTLLGYGNFDLDKLKNPGDGSFATGISANGKKVVGYFSTSGAAYVDACMWTENNGEWEMTWLPLPEDTKTSEATAISDDGNVIFGIIGKEDGNDYGIIWKDGTYFLISQDMVGANPNYSYQFTYKSMSPNGKFVTFSLQNGCTYIYNTENGEYRIIPMGDAIRSLSKVGIDNEGNAVSAYSYGSVSFGSEAYYRPFWYSYKEDRVLDLTYYMSIYAEGLTTDFSLSADDKTQAFPVAISADGLKIVGNVDTNVRIKQIPKCWIMEFDDIDMQIPATPTGLKGESKSFGHVHLTWDKDINTYNGFTLKSYNVYRDSVLVATVDVSDEVMKHTEENVPAGHPMYVVEAVFEKDGGGTMLSPKSAALKVAVLANYDMPLFEDFESGSIDENYWTTTCDYGDGDNASWRVGSLYGFSGNGISSTSKIGKPYSSSLVSRPLDATNEETVTISFIAGYAFINESEQDLNNDTISVEVSTDDGETWIEQKSWTIPELCPGSHFAVRSIDISKDAAGKVFRVRLRKHGKGTSSYYVNFDNIKIGTVAERETPTGLIGKPSDDKKSVTVAWQNPSQAYQLNYINEPASYMLTIGNEGKEIMAVNMFDQPDLAMYDGKHLTGVSTMINYYGYVETVKGIHASVVVFEDGKLIREQEIDNLPLNEDFTVILDQPVTINADKELKFGLKVFDYDAEQIPILYLSSPQFVAGKSDLYSEDGGATWLRLSDFYGKDTEEGQCCWYISGCVTDEPELTLSDEEAPMSYIVFRNGEQISPEQMDKMQTHYTDNAPVENACYDVVGYYMNGDISSHSEQVCFDITSMISNLALEGINVLMSDDNRTITIEGDFDNASLISANGVCIAKAHGNRISTGGLADGIYILQIEKDGKYDVHKFFIR